MARLDLLPDAGGRPATAGRPPAPPRTAGFDGLAARHGCATGAQLIEQVTGVSSRTARQRVRVAAQAAARVSDVGLPLPALFPATQAGLAGGVIGIDAADAITSTLRVLPGTVPVQALEAAEAALVGNAIGTEGTPPVCADLIRGQAALFRDRLDQDGIQPREDRMMAKRGIRFFRRPDGMLGVDGALVPAQEAIIVPVFDAFLSPRTAPAFLAAAEDGAHEAADGIAREGAAGDEAAGGGIQQVTVDSGGRVIDLSSKARFFTPSQRKAMIARDGPTCAKPGCKIPAYLAEAHHVIPDSEGGPTEVDNGCL